MFGRMTLLNPDEYTRMEQLLAGLLPECNAREEAALLHLHARLQAIYAAQRDLNTARDRLLSIRSQTAR